MRDTLAKRIWILAAIAALAMAGCGGDDNRTSPPPEVFVSIEPLAWFVRRIGGPHLAVRALVRPGQDPHTYAPTPRQMVQLSQAKLLLGVGLPMQTRIAAKLASVAAPVRIVDLSEGIDTLPAASHLHGHDRDHGPRAPDKTEMDPHIWMSPRIAKVLAQRICEQLIRLDPTGADAYRENLKSVETELADLDARLTRQLAPLAGKTFFVYHPAFGYFAEAYGLNQHAVETGGRSPGPRHIKRLVAEAKAEGVTIIFVQKQFSSQAAQSIARQIGGVVIALDPLAGDYITNMTHIADSLERALASPTL